MATENPMQMLSANGMRGRLGKPGNSTFSSGSSVSSGLQEEGAQELGMLLGSHAQVDTLNGIDKVLRSGSAPPTFDGSLASMTVLSSGSAFGEHFSASRIGDTVGSVDSEEELRSRPEYLAYYYSLINSNPRLPPPIISQENYVLARRLAACAVEEKRKLRTLVEGSSQSLFSAQPLFPTHNEEIESVLDGKVHDGKLYRQVSDNWVNRGDTDKFSGAPDHGLGARHKSLVDLIQEDFPRTPSPVYNQSRSSSHIANKEGDGIAHATQLRDPGMSTGVESSDTLSVSRSATPNNSIGTYNSSKVASLPRMPTPKPANRAETLDDTISGLKFSANLGSASNICGIASTTELAAALKGLNLASTRSPLTDQESEVNHPVEPHLEPHGHHRPLLTHRHHSMQFPKPQEAQSQALPHNFYQQQHFSGAQGKYDVQNFSSQSQNTLVQSGASNNMYAAAAAAMPYMAGGNPYYQNMQAANLYTSPAYGLGGYSVNSALIPGMLSNYSGYDTAAAAASETGVHAPTSGSSLDRQQLCKYMSQAAVPIQSSLLDPLCLQYLHQQSLDDAHAMLNATNMPSVPGYVGGSHIDMTELHKSQLLGYSNDQNHQFPRSGSLITMGSKSGPGSVFPHSSAVAGALSLRQVDRNYRFSPGGGRASIGGAYTGWQCQRGNDASDDIKGSFLLEELKNNKARRFELSDILGHVVEFSADQHGSRFIQQKLETASAEEKAATFQEVMPQALSLMTDVFGNYVIQKHKASGPYDP